MHRSHRLAPMSTRRSRFLLTSLRRYRRLRSPPPRTPSDPLGPPVVGIFTRSHMAGLLQSPGGPFPCRPTSHSQNWIGSKGALQPPAPCATWRAQLQAPRFSGQFQSIGDRLKLKCTNMSEVGSPGTFRRVCGLSTLSQIA